MSIKAVGFDWGGVLHGKPGIFFNERFAEFAGVSVTEFEEAYFSHTDKVNSGRISQAEFWDLVLNDLNRNDLIPQVQSFITDLKRGNILDQNMIALVDNLRKNGYKTGLLSNNSQEAADAMRTDGIDEHFDSFIVSAEVGYRKPDPEVFKLFIADLGIKPNELIFVDDSTKSLSTAEVCGYNPILFKSYEDLLLDLNILDIKFEVRP